MKLFNSQICPIIWSKVKVLMVDGGVEFQGNVIILMNEHGIQIQLANSGSRTIIYNVGGKK